MGAPSCTCTKIILGKPFLLALWNLNKTTRVVVFRLVCKKMRQKYVKLFSKYIYYWKQYSFLKVIWYHFFRFYEIWIMNFIFDELIPISAKLNKGLKVCYLILLPFIRFLLVCFISNFYNSSTEHSRILNNTLNIHTIHFSTLLYIATLGW